MSSDKEKGPAAAPDAAAAAARAIVMIQASGKPREERMKFAHPLIQEAALALHRDLNDPRKFDSWNERWKLAKRGRLVTIDGAVYKVHSGASSESEFFFYSKPVNSAGGNGRRLYLLIDEGWPKQKF